MESAFHPDERDFSSSIPRIVEIKRGARDVTCRGLLAVCSRKSRFVDENNRHIEALTVY
jgi:hypothetical protein